MLAEDDVIENAANTEHITDGMGLGRHVFDVDNFRSHVAWSSTPDEQIVGVIGDCCQSEINYDRLFA